MMMCLADESKDLSRANAVASVDVIAIRWRWVYVLFCFILLPAVFVLWYLCLIIIYRAILIIYMCSSVPMTAVSVVSTADSAAFQSSYLFSVLYYKQFSHSSELLQLYHC